MVFTLFPAGRMWNLNVLYTSIPYTTRERFGGSRVMPAEPGVDIFAKVLYFRHHYDNGCLNEES